MKRGRGRPRKHPKPEEAPTLSKAQKATLAKAAKAAKGKPEKSAKPEKESGLTTRARKAVSEADPDDLDAAKAAVRIIKRWDAWQKATGEMQQVGTQAGERVKSSEAAFRESVERGVSLNGGEEAAIAKLNAIVSSWQDWQEAIAQSAEERKEAKEKRTKAAKALERAIEESRQLSMFNDD